MQIIVQSKLAGTRRDGPRPDSLCADLPIRRTPLSLHLADEAQVTVTETSDGGDVLFTHTVRAVIGAGPDDEFTRELRLLGEVPALGLLDVAHVVDVSGTVAGAAAGCATAFAAAIAERLIDNGTSARIVVLDHFESQIAEVEI
ncbi:hypothetical protein [Rhodococcus qingshengii]|uniref:Uncharacterized protein n=1 Tax=Rhodococcus qingshengii TaxID=334542 RepID=A0A2A5IXU6_RHOSG|nr:hypothetical protein [Rhodococcus qingshengii]PCK22174.1 hypothetical protein CHR55_32995 [Rhodococcus qingshengii]